MWYSEQGTTEAIIQTWVMKSHVKDINKLNEIEWNYFDACL